MRRFAFFALAMVSACSSGSPSSSDTAAHAPPAQPPATSAVCDAYRAQSRRVEITTSGTVVKVLGIRTGPSGPHEGFLVATDPGAGCRITLRVEHNLDLAGRVPLTRGETVEIRGEYIYDPRGGILHWTHHDPRGRHPGGYIRANGELYQ